jgi:hypothetical protein
VLLLPEDEHTNVEAAVSAGASRIAFAVVVYTSEEHMKQALDHLERERRNKA